MGEEEEMDYSLTAFGETGSSLLHCAVIDKDYEFLETLLSHKHHLVPDKQWKTPLTIAKEDEDLHSAKIIVQALL